MTALGVEPGPNDLGLCSECGLPVHRDEHREGGLSLHHRGDACVGHLRRLAERQREALAKIDAVRNNIIGAQNVNWSRDIYPLVAALGEAGFAGEGYDAARRRLVEEGRGAKRAAAVCRARRSYWLETAEQQRGNAQISDPAQTAERCVLYATTCGECAELIELDAQGQLTAEWATRARVCTACRIEAEIGTEESPHPVPERFHTCRGAL